MHKIEGRSSSNPRVTFQFEPGEEVFIPEVVDEIQGTLKLDSYFGNMSEYILGSPSLSLDLGEMRPKGVYEGPTYPSAKVQAPPRGFAGPTTISHFYGVREVVINSNSVKFSQGSDKPQTSLTVYPDGSTFSSTPPHHPTNNS